MSNVRKYKKSDRTACLQLMHDRCLQNETLEKLADIFKAELGIQVSLPTVSGMRSEVQANILEKTASVAAEAQIKVLEKLKGIDTGRYVDILNAQVEELYGCLYDPYYEGKVPKPKGLNERLRMEAQLSTAIQNLLGIMGPPKKEESAYGGLIPKRDVMSLLAEREEIYKVQYLRDGMKQAAEPASGQVERSDNNEEAKVSI